MKNRCASAENSLTNISDAEFMRNKLTIMKNLQQLSKMTIKNREPLEHKDISFIADAKQIHNDIVAIGVLFNKDLSYYDIKADDPFLLLLD